MDDERDAPEVPRGDAEREQRATRGEQPVTLSPVTRATEARHEVDRRDGAEP